MYWFHDSNFSSQRYSILLKPSKKYLLRSGQCTKIESWLWFGGSASLQVGVINGHLMAYKIFNSRHAYIPMVLVVYMHYSAMDQRQHLQYYGTSTDSAYCNHPLLAVTLPSRLSTIKIKRMLCLLTHSREAVRRFQSKHFVATQTVFPLRPSPARGICMC